MIAGCWFIGSGAETLHRYPDLAPGAKRLLAGEIGATDVPIRDLVTLALAPVLIVVGVVLTARGIRWMRRVRLSPGPMAHDEAVAALTRHDLVAYGDGGAVVYWPLRRWLPEQLAEMTWWRREVISGALRRFVRVSALAFVVAVVCLVVPIVATGDPLGALPAAFVAVLPMITAISAAITFLLIASHPPRIESVELSRSDVGGDGAASSHEVIESAPRFLHWEPPGIGLALGIIGIGVQCLLPVWWDLPFASYPLVVTSIVRDAMSIAGGVFFLVLGERMVRVAAGLLVHARYESTLVVIDGDGSARAANLRTESLTFAGPRHIVSAVRGIDALESGERLVRGRGR